MDSAVKIALIGMVGGVVAAALPALLQIYLHHANKKRLSGIENAAVQIGKEVSAVAQSTGEIKVLANGTLSAAQATIAQLRLEVERLHAITDDKSQFVIVQKKNVSVTEI